MKRLLLVLGLLSIGLQAAEPASPGQGLKFLEAGAYAAARQVFESQDADCRFCDLYLGITDYREGRYAEARKAFETELAKADHGANPALTLGYVFLVQSQQPAVDWLNACLTLSRGVQEANPDDRLFMAQSILTAGSNSSYADPLREQAAREVLAQAKLVGEDKTGVRNMMGRAWILIGEVGKNRKNPALEREALEHAVAECRQEAEATPSAVYLQNASIAVRLLAELDLIELWKLPKMGPKVPKAVEMAQSVEKGYAESLELIDRAIAADVDGARAERLKSLKETALRQQKSFDDNKSIKKILGRK